ncbi:MAG: hypothetical protein QXT01_05215 [Sulfolobales archaeon]
MNKTLNKSIAITILTIVTLSIIPAVALVIPVKAQAYTITTSSAYLNNYSWIEIVVTGPREWDNVAFEVIRKDTGTPVNISPTPVIAKGWVPGVFVAYLAGKDVDVSTSFPQYNKTDALYRVTEDLTGTTLVIRVPALGFISTEVKYDFAPISISFDRSSYPPHNDTKVRLTVKDPNWNLDPTYLDTLNPSDVPVDIRIINASGTFPLSEVLGRTLTLSDIGITEPARETAINSGEFRFTFDLKGILDLAGSKKFSKGDVVEFTIRHINKPDIYDKKSFTIVSTAPTIELSGSFSDEITVRVTAPDNNSRTWEKDSITVYYSIYPEGGTISYTPVTADETDVNTGVFEKKISLNWDNDLLGNASIGKAILVRVNVSYQYEGKWVVRELKIVPQVPDVSIDKTVYFEGETVKLVVKDPDLNDDKDTVEVYASGTLTGPYEVRDVPLSKAGLNYLNISILKLPEEIPVNVSSGETILFSAVERYDEPGVFDLKINLSKLDVVKDTSYRIKIGDRTSGKYVSVDFKVVAKEVKVELDRDAYPLPKDRSLTVYVRITDPDANVNPYAKDTITSGVTCGLYNYTGGLTAYSCSVGTLTETDVNTGVFEGKVTVGPGLDTDMINGWVNITYKGKSATARFVITSATLDVNVSVVKYGDAFKVVVVDRDANLDSKSVEEITITIDGVPKPLKETGPNTGVFEGSFVVAFDADVPKEPAGTIEVKYVDTTPGYVTPGAAWDTLELSKTIKVASFTGSLRTDKTEYGPSSKITITVVDWDANRNIKSLDRVTVEYTIEGVPGIRSVSLDETGVSTGIFEGELDLTTVGVAAKDLVGKMIRMVYRDPYDEEGKARTSVAIVRVISVDPVIEFDKSSYNVGDVAKITIKDMDANRDPNTIESLIVRVYSDSDPVGTTLSAAETGKDTGVFVTSVLISDIPGGGRVYAKPGDKVYVEYKDEFPADYGVTGKSKMFTASVPVGVPIEKPLVPKKASFIDPRTGATIAPKVGSMVGISVELSNVGVTDQVFTAILVVKDPEGVVVSVQSVSIPLAAGKSGTVTFSFIPKMVGDFGIEVYIVRSLADWSPLGEMLAATMTVAS